MPQPITNAIDIMSDALAHFIASLPAILVALIIFFIAYRLANPVSEIVRSTLQKARRSQSLQLIFGRLTRWTVIILGFLLAAMIALPDFSPSELISILGVSSVAIGFAFRDILQNFLAGYSDFIHRTL